MADDRLATIGNRYDKSAAQVALRWLVQRDNVCAIPKASNRDHFAANIDVFGFELSVEEMDEIGGFSPLGLGKLGLQNAVLP